MLFFSVRNAKRIDIHTPKKETLLLQKSLCDSKNYGNLKILFFRNDIQLQRFQFAKGEC